MANLLTVRSARYGHVTVCVFFPRKAWTGGERPEPNRLESMHRDLFEGLRGQLYREQYRDYAQFWASSPDRDTRYLMWTRATFDAWRTMFPDGVTNALGPEPSLFVRNAPVYPRK